MVRADASHHAGTGHVMRCLTLARALRDDGDSVTFACRDVPGHMIGEIRSEGFDVDVISFGEVNEAADAEQSAHAAHARGARTVIVDHYALGVAWETTLRRNASRVFAIDDLLRRHDADLLLDQNYFGRSRPGYVDRVPPECVQLVGPQFALLRPEFRFAREKLRRRFDSISRVLVFFGGADPWDATGKALDALSRPEFGQWTVNIILGRSYAFRDQILVAAARRPNTRVHGQQPHLADVLSGADLCVGACGATTWERLCLGVPSVGLTIADNQRSAAAALGEDGYLMHVGDAREVRVTEIVEGLRRMADPALRRRMSELGMSLVDGRGVERVIEAIRQAA